MAGYHIKKISKGKYGSPSKIKEELEELEDAIEQGNKIMALVELADIYGAVEGVAKTLGVTMKDLRVHAAATSRMHKEKAGEDTSEGEEETDETED